VTAAAELFVPRDCVARNRGADFVQRRDWDLKLGNIGWIDK